MNWKGQTTIEYLTTYGWMVAAVAIAAAAFYPTVRGGCNVKVNEDLSAGALTLDQVGVDKAGSFQMVLDSNSKEEIVVDSATLTEDNDTIKTLRRRILDPGTDVVYPVGDVKKTGTCQEYDLKLSFKKGSLQGQSKTVEIEGSFRFRKPPHKVLDFRFDREGGDRVNDYSGEKNYGTLQPNASAGPKWVDGVKGSALKFDGSDNLVKVPDDPSLDADLEEATFSAWVRFNQETTETEERVLIHQQSGTTPYNIYRDDGERIVFNGRDFDSTTYSDINDIKWHHVAGTVNKTHVRLFIDGRLESSNTGNEFNITDGSPPLWIGGDGTVDNRYLNGSIDQVRIYNRSLSKQEVWKLYTMGRDRSSDSEVAGPVAHYPMQVESSPLRDTSGEGNHGELNLLGESGTFNTSDGEWKTVSFNRSYEDPVVIGTTNTHSGEAAIYFEVRDVDSGSAEMRLCESEGGNEDGCDTHVTERAGYVVVDAASTDDIPGIEAGSFKIDSRFDSKRETISYSESFSSTPMVFTQVMSDNGEGEIESWILNNGLNDFQAGSASKTLWMVVTLLIQRKKLDGLR